MLILLGVPPAIRLAIGVVAVALGLVLHLVWLALVGAVVIVVGAAQWFYRRRGAGLRR